MHTHMPFASALTRLEDMRLLPIGQTEVGVLRNVAYDEHYTGPAFDPGEGERLARLFGDKKTLFMANHGVATIGRTVAEAYDRLYYVERAAQVQVYATDINPAAVEMSAKNYIYLFRGGHGFRLRNDDLERFLVNARHQIHVELSRAGRGIRLARENDDRCPR